MYQSLTYINYLFVDTEAICMSNRSTACQTRKYHLPKRLIILVLPSCLSTYIYIYYMYMWPCAYPQYHIRWYCIYIYIYIYLYIYIYIYIYTSWVYIYHLNRSAISMHSKLKMRRPWCLRCTSLNPPRTIHVTTFLDLSPHREQTRCPADQALFRPYRIHVSLRCNGERWTGILTYFINLYRCWRFMLPLSDYSIITSYLLFHS